MADPVSKHHRIVGIILKNDEVLIIHRVKPERDYYVWPGGKIESGESEGQALCRELKEELNFEIGHSKYLFAINYLDHDETYYLVDEFSGELALGGPEKDRMNEQNKYSFNWVKLSELNKVPNLVPKETVEKILFELSNKSQIKILIFLQGTIIVHKGTVGKSRSEIVQQVINQEEVVRDFASYEPIGQAVAKLNKWAEQGAEIVYLSALTKNKKARGDELVGDKGLKADQDIINKFGFPKGEIFQRQPNESYADVIGRIKPLPNILIEDNCESIGGLEKMVSSQIEPSKRNQIKLVVVPEFAGLDHLPNNIKDLLFV